MKNRMMMYATIFCLSLILIGLSYPLIVYNDTEVDVATVFIGLNTEGSSLLMAEDSLQIPTLDPALRYARVEVGRMSVYNYMIIRNTERVEVSGETGEGVAQIIITFALLTPSGETLEFNFSPTSGRGLQEVIILLGPEDGLVAGEFSLTITISIKIIPPGFISPIADVNLDPVDISFEIP